MSHGWKVTVIVVAVAAMVSTPLVWLMNGPDGGQFIGASVQAAVGIVALLWAILQHPQRQPQDRVSQTGVAHAEDGGTAHTGIKRPGGRGRGAATARRTGKATARGRHSSAGTGIDHG
ncbi:hypothetical protein ACFQ6E_38415 [Streptomyces sp. NPDC056462]|uniref:hypothetical protein n=1 Tax=Streptomyces sp. NPDC056462 TaxID=3345826 RepID=UPI00367A578E